MLGPYVQHRQHLINVTLSHISVAEAKQEEVAKDDPRTEYLMKRGDNKKRPSRHMSVIGRHQLG